MAVASSLGGQPDDDEPPTDPWADGARLGGGQRPDDDSHAQQRGRRAWRRSDTGEPPSGADGVDPQTGNDEPYFSSPPDDTYEGDPWSNWQGTQRGSDFSFGRPQSWSWWQSGWDWQDRANDGWQSQRTSTTASAEPTPPAQATATGWTRMTSGATTRRSSTETCGNDRSWGMARNYEQAEDYDRERYERRGGVGEKMSVLTFTAEDQGEKLGSSARSYIRQIEAWTQVTRTPKAQQAVLLYQSLGGRAWIEAEELQVSDLATDDGVDKLKAWVMERYQEVEVGKIAEALNGLIEVDCRLPETAKAWAYLNALALNHSEELTILGSVANEYVTAKLQRAAVLHEKSLKRP